MLRTFQAHPGGPLGLAILLLRGSAAVALVTVAIVGPLSNPAIIASISILAIALLLGIKTKLVTALAAAIALVTIFHLGWSSSGWHLAFALQVGAVFLLGPGAFSIDALRFGKSTLRLDGTSHPKV